jgi:hypothetical protein
LKKQNYRSPEGSPIKPRHVLILVLLIVMVKPVRFYICFLYTLTCYDQIRSSSEGAFLYINTTWKPLINIATFPLHLCLEHDTHRTGPLERASEPNRAKITNPGTEVQGHQRRAPPTHYLLLYISKRRQVSKLSYFTKETWQYI